ncbi:PAS domain S-box protein [Hymenobacter sp. BT186]|uniref:Sensory/regulatory protein RpfC n=1 Tax=Hymenobacter telluris TaxID=2816474 RepID=A0A939JE47_9BACT|nr:PAS domain S-box protein [Hymenobacter telluris]MBO0359593.1 PAS domain S-box protein [Hymenobacter telluris]MBW3375620.1 PAS domain S-box protein [Hymenobacter norwichensis]
MEKAGTSTSLLEEQTLPGQQTAPGASSTLHQLTQSLLLVQQAFAAVAILTDHGQLVWVNEGFTEIIGLSPERLASHPVIWEILPPVPAASFTAPVSLLAHSVVGYETLVQTDNRSARWLRVKLQPALLPSQVAPDYFLALFEDITDEKATQAAAAAQQAQLRYLDAQAPGVLFQWRANPDGSTALTYIGSTAQAIFGFQPATLAELTAVVHPQEQAQWMQFLNAASSKAAPTFEGRLLVPGQPLRWCSASYQLSTYDAAGALYSGVLQDISPLREAEEAVLENEARWLMAIERFGDGAWEFNYQTGDDYFSSAYRAMLGYPDEDFPTGFQAWHNHVHPDDQAASLEAADAYLRGDVPIYSVERRLLCRNGEYKWVLTRGLITKRDAEGKPLIMTGVHTDISEIKKANLAIEAAQRHLAATIANFQEGILLEDENRRVVLVNEAFCRMLQLEVTPDYLTGMETETLMAATQANTRAEQGWLTGSNGSTLKQHAVIGDLLVRKNGQVFQRDFIPVSSNQVALGYLWKFQDVTEQKNAEEALKRREEKYRRIIEQMKLGLVESNLTDDVLYVNQVLRDTLGFSPDEVITQQMLRSLLIEQGSEPEAEDEQAYEVATWSKDGRHKWLQVSRSAVYNDDQQRIGTIRITLDITHQKELENKLRTAKDFAEESSRAKELFLANMSHEIRTPMNAILGMAHLMSKTLLSSEQDDYLRAISTSGANLLVIINDILDLSKIEAGQLQMERIGFNPSQLIAQIEKTLLYRAEEQGLTFVAHAAPELPPVLLGDPYRITQVLLNLAGNAIKFTEKGRVTISCELLGHADELVEIKFTVADTGIGIDPAYLNDIFKEFSQEDPSVTRKFGGTGLGLSISKSLVTLMGGELRLHSEKHIGTVSSFTLQLPQGSEQDLPHREIIDQGRLKKLKNRKVLLVEDNKFNRQIAKALLTNVQLQVDEAENGEVAVDMLRHHRYDLVLMDVQMPVLNGLEATAILRAELGLTTPIIALTANAIKGEREKCIAAGMNDYLAKPFQEAELLKLVGDWILGASAPHPVTPPKPAPVAAPSDAPLYKLDLLYQIGQGDQGFVALMLESFIESCEEAAQDLHQTLLTQDGKLLKATTHKLKPSLDHLHIYQLLPLVKRLDAWDAAYDATVLPPLIKTVIELLEQIIRQMTIDLAAVTKTLGSGPDSIA